MNRRVKKILKLILFALTSAFFLYNGFTMLIDESNNETSQHKIK